MKIKDLDNQKCELYTDEPGIHIAHARWAQRPSVVGFIAPPKKKFFHWFNVASSMALSKRSSNDI